jgi:hypothetical protein
MDTETGSSGMKQILTMSELGITNLAFPLATWTELSPQLRPS